MVICLLKEKFVAIIKTQDLVQDFCSQKQIADNLLFIQTIKSFFLYDEEKKYYRHLKEDYLEGMVFEYVKAKERSIGKNFIKDFLYLMTLQCYKKIEILPFTHIALKDGLLNVKTFEMEEPNKNIYAHFFVPCQWSNMRNSPARFLNFLNYVLIKNDLSPDEELINVLQEMMGFFLLPELKPQVMFFLIGEGGNGKSVFTNILTALIGKEFISSFSIQALTTQRFTLTGLIGKRVNICNEEESKFMKADKFKALISGDAIQGERKYGDTFTLYPNTKFLFSTNNIPTFEHIDRAIKRRVRIIPFKRDIDEKDFDDNLTDKLLTELEGIFGWAIAGAKRLVANNYKFSASSAMNQSMIDFENAISSAATFIREKYQPDNNEFIANDVIYADYGIWCEVNGRKPLNSSNFHKDVTRIFAKESVIGWDKERSRTCRGRNLKLLYETAVSPSLPDFQ